jgi:hypothetical protein
MGCGQKSTSEDPHGRIRRVFSAVVGILQSFDVRITRITLPTVLTSSDRRPEKVLLRLYHSQSHKL